MALIRVPGAADNYLFDPHNPSTLLKRNGKFGSVYAGIRESDKKHVLIKFMNPDLKWLPHAVVQFRFEAMQDLNHPALRKTYEFVKTEGEFFLIQEYVGGVDLKTFLKWHPAYRKSLPFIVACGIKILEALEYLHSKNIIHCDVKPSNILIEYLEKKLPDKKIPPVRLIDLGQAKTEYSNFQDAAKPFSLVYSPPEQALHFHDLVAPASDLFALAVTLHELITGKNPYGVSHPEMIMHMQASGQIVPDEKIPETLFKILSKATARIKFPLPPNQMDVVNQKSLVAEGIKLRYADAATMKAELVAVYSALPERKSLFAKIFGG